MSSHKKFYGRTHGNFHQKHTRKPHNKVNSEESITKSQDVNRTIGVGRNLGKGYQEISKNAEKI
jgi:hypothetical protein